MDKNKFFKLVCFCLAIFISCEKNEVYKELERNVGSFVEIDGQVLTKNPNSITDFLQNKTDPDDEKIRKQRFEIGLLVRDLFTDINYNKMLIDNALNRANNAVCLQMFASESQTLKSASDHDQEIFLKLQNTLSLTDFTRKSTNPLKQGIFEEYIPALFLINPETADYNKQPLISPGIEVNSELPGMANYDEFIVAWFADEKGEFQEVLIDEEFAMKTTHPIFSVDNAEYQMTHSPKSKITILEPENILKNQQTAWYSTNEYRINHRYESNSESEFTITAARIDQNGVVHWTLRESNGTGTLYKKIADVNKSDIGKNLSKWVQFCNEAPIPFNENFVFFNTYERDWWGSEKSLGQVTKNGTTIRLSGNRTYTSDWYAYDPDVLQDNPIDMDKVYWSWAEWHHNEKGYIRFWRIQP